MTAAASPNLRKEPSLMAQLETVHVTVDVSVLSAQLDRAGKAVRRLTNQARTANQEMAKLRDTLAALGIEYVEDREVTDND